jgi:hypothetical protein
MWQWLELHGATVQIASSLIATLIGIMTIIVLLMTWSAARNAAHASSEQATAAKAQQVAAERAAAAAEAQVAAAEASGNLARQQLLAVQESAAAERTHSELIRQQTQALLRPILAFSHRTSSSGYIGWTVLENQSEALALEVTAIDLATNKRHQVMEEEPGT